MQIIVGVGMTVREYVERAAHRLIRPEPPCPQCGKSHPFEALGYYQRWVTDEEGRPWLITVRRFVSDFCAGSISCLPAFCQPYRLLHNQVIEASIWKERPEGAEARWLDLLAAYRRRFQWWCDCLHDPRMGAGLRATLGERFGRSPPRESPSEFWARIVASCGQCLKATTGRLVQEFRITLFGRYRCHQPRCQRSSGLEAG